MANDAELKIRISAELKELRTALAAARQDIRSVGNQVEATGRGKGLSGLEKGISGIASAARGLIGGFAALATIKSFVDLADQAKTLDARLKLATTSQEEFARAQAGTFQIAQETRTQLAQTVDLYAKLSTATKDAPRTQGELLRVTELINKSVQLANTGAAGADAAIVQLAQGLASGTLRGEELNSVMEQTPRLAQALAAGMGVGIGELRKLGQEGKISANEAIGALLSQGKALDAEFAQLPITTKQASTQLQNSIQGIVAQFEAATNTSGGLAQAISSLAGFIDQSDLLGPVIEEAEAFGASIGLVVDDVQNLADVLQTELLSALQSTSEGQAVLDGMVNGVDLLSEAFGNLPQNIRAFVQLMVVEIAAFKDRVIAIAQAIKDGIAAPFNDDTVNQVGERLKRQIEIINQAREDSIISILKERDAQLEAGEAARKRYDAERIARKRAAEDAERERKGAGAGAAAGGSAKPQEVARVNQASLAKADAEQALRDIDQLYAAAGIKQADYYAQKRQLSQQITALEIQELQARLAAADKVEQKSKLLTDIELTRKKGISNQSAINAEEAAANEARVNQTEQLQIELARVEGRAVEARTLQLRQQYADTLKRMEAEGDKAGIAIIEKIINTEASKAQLDELQDQAEKVISELRAKQESLANRVQVGDVTQSSADVQLGEDRTAAAQKLAEIREQMKGLPDDTRGVNEAVDSVNASLERLGAEGLTGVDLAIANIRNGLIEMRKTFATTLADSAVDGLANMFTSLADGSKSAGDALKDFVRGFAQSMAQMAARALAMMAVLAVLNAIPGGAAVASAMDMSARVQHRGGMAGTGPRRRVDPALFLGAPRYHAGGVAGLKSGEIPAILQTGEEVLARNDPRNVTNGGGSGGVRVINVVDPNIVHDYLSSSSGEKVILNTIERNKGAVRQKLT